jgi:GGDEF domain-containing protein
VQFRVKKPVSVARIGGDKFAVLLLATGIAGGEAVLATLAGLIELNNQYYPDFEFSISTASPPAGPATAWNRWSNAPTRKCCTPSACIT